MKVPSCVLWHLTKKSSAFVVQPKGSKARKECFSSDPLNATGLHNASAQGYTAEESVGVSAERGESEKKKGFRKVFTVSESRDSTKLLASSKKLNKGAPKTAKYIQGLDYLTAKKKALLLKRVAKLNRGLNKKN